MATLERGIAYTGAADQPEAGRQRVWTRAEYYRMADAGILGPRERVELIEGDVLTLSPIGPLHSNVGQSLYNALRDLVSGTLYVMHERPIVLSDLSEPQPDVAVAAPSPDDYATRHPAASEVLLVVEVSATSLAADRRHKRLIYGKAGIPAYWIIDLEGRRVEVLTEPTSDGYANSHFYTPVDTIPLPFAPGKIPANGFLKNLA